MLHLKFLKKRSYLFTWFWSSGLDVGQGAHIKYRRNYRPIQEEYGKKFNVDVRNLDTMDATEIGGPEKLANKLDTNDMTENVTWQVEKWFNGKHWYYFSKKC